MVVGEKLEEQLQMKGNPDQEEFEKQKDGTPRILCTCCKRKMQQCPACEFYYDSEKDLETRKRKCSKDDSNSEESSDDDDDNSAEHQWQKMRRLQKSIRKNEEEVTDESEEESDEEKEEDDE